MLAARRTNEIRAKNIAGIISQMMEMLDHRAASSAPNVVASRETTNRITLTARMGIVICHSTSFR